MPFPEQISSVLRTAASGLRAQRVALGAIAENIANASTSRTEDGTPYDIKRAVHTAANDRYDQFASLLEDASANELRVRDPRHLSGLSLPERLDDVALGPTTEVEEIARERLVYDPSHPHADENGFVHYPDINIVGEMTRMISAQRIYEANLTTVQAVKQMFKNTMQI